MDEPGKHGGEVPATPPPKPPMSEARIGGMVATVALLVMFALAAALVVFS